MVFESVTPTSGSVVFESVTPTSSHSAENTREQTAQVVFSVLELTIQ